MHIHKVQTDSPGIPRSLISVFFLCSPSVFCGISHEKRRLIRICAYIIWSGLIPLCTMWCWGPFPSGTWHLYNVASTSMQRHHDDVASTLTRRCINFIPADTQRWNNVDSTLIQRQDVESTLNRRCFTTLKQHRFNVDSTLIQRLDVESTLNRRCFNVVCLLGCVRWIGTWCSWKKLEQINTFGK